MDPSHQPNSNVEEQDGHQKQTLSVPIIDLSQSDSDHQLARSIAHACSTIGFFQVLHHGIPPALIQRFRQQCKLFFALPRDVKLQLKRNASNARGYFDDELTKQRRDWKEAFDFGVQGEHCLDGSNQFPSEQILPQFRDVMMQYFDACAELSHRLAVLMVRGLRQGNTAAAVDEDDILDDLKHHHSSYMRMNYYPPCTETQATEHESPLGISPHYDAGFLTVLLQDDDCHSLQVQPPSTNGEAMPWITVHPEPGALTINTGDMAQIWSNGRYKAPLHRVLTNNARVRYSTPFFYNPSYRCMVQPVIVADGNHQETNYHLVSWGYFRALRFAGDLTDLGVEIQISHFERDDENGKEHSHLRKQQLFLEQVDLDEPFSVEKHRQLLTMA